MSTLFNNTDIIHPSYIKHMGNDFEIINGIDVFPEDNPLSNCFLVSVVFQNIQFPSAEHAYQAMKFFHPEYGWRDAADVVEAILNAPTGPDSKDIAEKYESRMVVLDRDAKVDLIYQIMRQKFLQNPFLQTALLQTGDSIIFEEYPESTGGSSAFWGNDSLGEGENVIGNILMNLRDEFSM